MVMVYLFAIHENSRWNTQFCYSFRIVNNTLKTFKKQNIKFHHGNPIDKSFLLLPFETSNEKLFVLNCIHRSCLTHHIFSSDRDWKNVIELFTGVNWFLKKEYITIKRMKFVLKSCQAFSWLLYSVT